VDGIPYAFGELLKDIGGWLLLGVLIAILVTKLVPDGFFALVFEYQVASLLDMLLVSIPLIYVCQSFNTHCCGTYTQKLSPGAALVFLLTGQATNAATIFYCRSFLGSPCNPGLSGDYRLFLANTWLANQCILLLGSPRYHAMGGTGTRGKH
jgi:uncharacterized membrane protein YraQ (UPF0718 family)